MPKAHVMEGIDVAERVADGRLKRILMFHGPPLPAAGNRRQDQLRCCRLLAEVRQASSLALIPLSDGCEQEAIFADVH